MFRFWYFDPGYISHTLRVYSAQDMQESLALLSLSASTGEYIIYES